MGVPREWGALFITRQALSKLGPDIFQSIGIDYVFETGNRSASS
jgi:hypothetical protein